MIQKECVEKEIIRYLVSEYDCGHNTALRLAELYMIQFVMGRVEMEVYGEIREHLRDRAKETRKPCYRRYS